MYFLTPKMKKPPVRAALLTLSNVCPSLQCFKKRDDIGQ